MPRLAHFRAVIETSRGAVARLAHHWQTMTMNDKNSALRVTASHGGGWELTFRHVQSIDLHGATLGAAFASLNLSPEDITALQAGRVKLDVVPVHHSAV